MAKLEMHKEWGMWWWEITNETGHVVCEENGRGRGLVGFGKFKILQIAIAKWRWKNRNNKKDKKESIKKLTIQLDGEQ